MICNLFVARFRRGLSCFGRALAYCGFILRHTNSNTLQSFFGYVLFRCCGLLHTSTRCASAVLPEQPFSARPHPSPDDQLQCPPRVRPTRSKYTSLAAASV